MRPKFLLILSLVMMLAPTLLYWIGPLRRPAMADGDTLVLVACPVCSGSGQIQGQKCSRCRGKKEVQGILPGPHRPIYLEGHVYAPDGVTPVPAADVEFSSEAGSWARKTDEQGRFGADLGPGNYPLKLTSPVGHLSTTIEVPVQREAQAVDLDPRFPTRKETYILTK